MSNSARKGADATGRRPTNDWVWLAAAGLFAGTAGLFKQVGLLVILFFVLNEVLVGTVEQRIPGRDRGRRTWSRARMIGIVVRLGFIGMGAALVGAVLMAWLWKSGAVFGFWRNAVQLGALYIGSLPAKLWLKFLFLRPGPGIDHNILVPRHGDGRLTLVAYGKRQLTGLPPIGNRTIGVAVNQEG